MNDEGPPGAAPSLRPDRPRFLEGFLFALITGLVLHALYGALGFNPTDEGFLLAQSRRILDGEFPHRDFLSPRPVGSPLLHAHLLLWAGESVLWWGRAIAAFQIGAIAWLAGALASVPGLVRSGPAGRLERLTVAAAAIPVSVHIFPIMPWHTIDATFLLLLGTWLARSAGRSAVTLAPRTLGGLAIAGLAVLCRQNFAPAVLLAPFVAGRARSVGAWSALLVPTFAYGAFLGAAGALPAAAVQLGSNAGSLYGVVTVGLRLDPPWPAIGLVLGLAASSLLLAARAFSQPVSPRAALSRFAAALLLFVPVGVAGWQSGSTIPWGVPSQGWITWGALLGFLPALASRSSPFRPSAPAAILALAAGASAGISLGHPAPSLAGGGAWVLCTLYAYRLLPPPSRRGARFLTGLLAFALALLALRFHEARTTLVYQDLPATVLDRDAGDVLPGARGLRTSERTHAMLRSLRAITRSLEADTALANWVVVPDLAAARILAARPNPLPADWLYPVELASTGAPERVGQALLGAHGPDAVIVQRYAAAPLPWRNVPAETAAVPAIAEVVRNWRLLHDSDPWFRVYARPGRVGRPAGDTPATGVVPGGP